MEIHCDDMVATSSLKHIGNKLGGNGGTALVFLILAGIGKVGYDGSDTTS